MLSPASPTFLGAPTTTSLSAASTSRCPKCGTAKKSGKRSCCARGGSWFRSCGDSGDTQVDHTWAEGIQACKDFASAFIPTQEGMLRHVGAIGHPVNITQPRNATQRQTDIYRSTSVSNAANNNPENRVGLSQVGACICVLLILLHCCVYRQDLLDLVF